MGPQAIPTGIYGPLPKGTMGLILGRSSLTMRGFQVLPGVIDQDYTGEIKVIAQTTNTIIQIFPETRIAQIIILPYFTAGKLLSTELRGEGGFGSSNQMYWAQLVKRGRPELELKLNGKVFLGTIDTGADVSVIASRHWPPAWPLNTATANLQGIGQVSQPQQSAQLIKWEDLEGNTGYFTPYVLNHLPINLWGRDILEQMGVLLMSPNAVVTAQMLNQGFYPVKGLGKRQQGRVSPIPMSPQQGRRGLGYREPQPFH